MDYSDRTTPLLGTDKSGACKNSLWIRHKNVFLAALAVILISVLLVILFFVCPVTVSISQSVSGSTNENNYNMVSVGDKVKVDASSNTWNSFVCTYKWTSSDGRSSTGGSYQHTVQTYDTTNDIKVECMNPFGLSLSPKKSSTWYTIITSNNSREMDATSVVGCTHSTAVTPRVPLFPSNLNETINVGDVLYTSACNGFVGKVSSMQVTQQDVLLLTYVDASFEDVYVTYSQPNIPYAFPSIYDNTTSSINSSVVVPVPVEVTNATTAGDSQYTVTWTGGSITLYQTTVASLVVNFNSFGWGVGGSTPTLVYTQGKLQQMSIILNGQVSFSCDLVWSISAAMEDDQVLKTWETADVLIPTPPTVWSAKLSLGMRTHASAAVEATWTANFALSYQWEVTWSKDTGWSSKVLSQQIDMATFAPSAFAYSGEVGVEVYLDLGIDVDQVLTFGDEQVFSLVLSAESSPTESTTASRRAQEVSVYDCSYAPPPVEATAYWQWKNNIFADFHLYKIDLEKYTTQVYEGEKHYVTVPTVDAKVRDSQPNCVHFLVTATSCSADSPYTCEASSYNLMLAANGQLYSNTDYGGVKCGSGWQLMCSDDDCFRWRWQTGNVQFYPQSCFQIYSYCPNTQCGLYYSTPYEYNIVVENIYYVGGTWQPYYYFNLDMTTGLVSALPASSLRSAPLTQAASSELMVLGCDQCSHDPCGLWPFWKYVVDPPTCPAPSTLPEYSANPPISKDLPWANKPTQRDRVTCAAI